MDGVANHFVAIDADGHVQEPDELFSEYLAPAFRARAQGGAYDQNNNRRYFFDGVGHPPFPREISIRKPMKAEDRLKVLDKERILSAVLFPSGGLVAGYQDGADFVAACIEAYNDWIADYTQPCAERLRWVAMVALNDPAVAIREAQRARTKGAIAICIRPNPTLKRTLDDPRYDPFYAAVQELGVPLIVHESTGCPDTAAGDRYGMMVPERYAFNHVISHSFEQMFAALSLICGGVLDRFPRLRVGFFEAGCSWAPYWIARLDDHFHHRVLGRYFPIKMKPSEYFARQCVVTCDPHDHTIPLAVQGIGADRILFATDYPHFDSGGQSVRAFEGVAGISAADRRKILWNNAATFYGIEAKVSA
ncbi:MAG: amidohydrolase [Alphaproteobacteria bacterium]|nr:amidohydrolase [Alphaproteobacteria bacterium]